MNRLNLKPSGVTLLELLLLIIIVGIAVVPVFSVYNQAMLSQERNLIKTTLTFLAQYEMESVLATDFFELSSNGQMPFSFCFPGEPSGSSGWLRKFGMRAYVYSINPDAANDLASSTVEIYEPGPPIIDSHYKRVYVEVGYDPTATADAGNPPQCAGADVRDHIELWSLITPAAQGY